MKATEILISEHIVIKRMLEIIKTVCEKLSANELIDGKLLLEIISFCRGFADACHHGKEEKILFRELIKAGMPEKGGPIEVMLAEHEMGRGLIAKMSSAADGYSGGEPSAAAGFIANAR